MKTSDKIRALPWKGNARDDLIKPDPLNLRSKSTLDIANELIERETDADEAWEAEKALNWCCFGELVDDGQREEWERMMMR